MGRPRGYRHKIFEAFIADLLADYEKHGRQTLDRMRKQDPTAYIRMIASLVPKQVEKTPNPLEHFRDEELDQLEAYHKPVANEGTDEHVEHQPSH